MKSIEWKRAAISLGAVLVAYAAYVLAVVPWIEPSLRRRSPTDVESTARQFRSTERFQQQLKHLFPADAWEMQQPNVLHSEGMTVLFQDYQPRDDGTVRIFPCTVVLQRDDPSADTRLTAPLILQAPEGALLRLNRPLDLRTTQVGQPVEGRLLGEIRIHSPGTGDGRGQLNIVTSNVQIKPQQLWTPHDVVVEYDNSSARGQDLMIKLLPERKDAGRRQQAGLAGIQSLELVRLDHLHLELESIQAAAKPGSAPTGPAPTVDVTCRGPVRIDLVANLATFEDQVLLRRREPDGVEDTLHCDRLSLYLEPASAPAPVETGAPTEAPRNAVPRWTVRQVMAEGEPAELRVASKKAWVRGRKLLYDLQRRRFQLWAAEDKADDQVLLRQETHELLARNLDCQLNADRSIDHLQALGPGRYQGIVPGQPPQQLAASWAGELRLQRDADGHVLTLDRDASVQLGPDRAIEADQLQLWLEAAPRLLVDNTDTQVDLRPKRLLAVAAPTPSAPQGVRIRSPELNAQTARLEALFRHQLPTARTQVQPVSATLPEPRGRLRGIQSVLPAAPVTAPRGNLEVAGQSVDVVFQLAGREITVQQVALRGQAELRQRAAADAPGQAFRLLADAVDVRDVNGQGAHQVVASGQPVLVQTDRFTMQSGQLNLDRQQNLLWTDGPGKIMLQVDRDPRGQPLSAPQQFAVQWQRQMRFDGSVIRFAGDVEVLGQLQRVRAEQLAVALNRHLDFVDTAANRGELQIRQIQAEGNVLVENREIVAGQQRSSSYLQVPQLLIDQQTGQAQAQGPGRLVMVRQGFAQTPGLPGPAAAARDASPAAEQQLTFVQVEFQRQMQGDLQRRVVQFRDRVQVLYGPVLSWNETLQVDARLRADDVLLTCDQLSLAEGPALPDGKRSVSLQTEGNTYVEGQSFTARGERVSYEQAKDLLVLEGTARADAVLSHQVGLGGRRTEHAARKILFWPQTQRVEVDDARYLDLSNFGGG